MKVENWEQARERLIERRPELDPRVVGVLRVRDLWTLGNSFAFAVRAHGVVELIWVGPRGAVNSAMRHTERNWRELQEALL